MGTSDMVHREWAKRPDDERFLTVESLREMVAGRTTRAAVVGVNIEEILVRASSGELYLNTQGVAGG